MEKTVAVNRINNSLHVLNTHSDQLNEVVGALANGILANVDDNDYLIDNLKKYTLIEISKSISKRSKQLFDLHMVVLNAVNASKRKNVGLQIANSVIGLTELTGQIAENVKDILTKAKDVKENPTIIHGSKGLTIETIKKELETLA